MVITSPLGHKGAKCVERIELTERAVEGVWEQHGHSYGGEVPADRLREENY